MPQLTQQLLQKGVLDKKKAEQVEREAKKSGRKEEEILLGQRLVDEEALFEVKSQYLGVPLKKDIFPEDVPLEVLALIPEEAARYYKMVPLATKEETVEIGMLYPEDVLSQEALKFLARRGGFSYEIVLILPTAFDQVARRYRTFKGEVTEALGELEEEVKKERKKGKKKTTAESLERLVEEAPITRVVAVLLRNAVEGKASDLHIEPTRKELRVRMRQDGILRSRLVLPLKVQSAVVTRVKILSNLRIDESRVPQDGRFSMRIEDRDIDFRVSTFPTAKGEKVAIRILDPTAGLQSLPDLGLQERNLKMVESAIKQPFGLILSTGPTGSGKTTSLYALLRILNQERVNVVTLEDPIEYFIEGVNQSQVRPEIGYEFASGLRSILRQDPNIIMVGEIRDKETASLATHAALTGHIVLSTLHTNNAIGVIPRLIDLGVAPYLIPPTLRLAMAQRLVRRLCDSCKEKTEPSKEHKDFIERELQGIPPAVYKDSPASKKEKFIWKAKGCRKCRSSGYAGRIAIFEILQVTEKIAQIIPGRPSEEDIFKIAKEQGMITMRQDGVLKVLQGMTSIEEVIRVTEEQ